MADYKSVGDYFSLWGPRPVFGKGGTENVRQVYLFAGVILGASCKVIYDAFTNASDIELKAFVISLIASVLIFPQLYYTGGLNKRKLSLAHCALAFQNGFFWNIALDTLFKKYGS